MSDPLFQSSAAHSVEWYLPGGDRLIWQDYGGSPILFNPDSGRTHALERWVADILEELQRGPVSGAALVERLGLEGEGDDIGEKIQRTIWTLDQLGLILPVGL